MTPRDPWNGARVFVLPGGSELAVQPSEHSALVHMRLDGGATALPPLVAREVGRALIASAEAVERRTEPKRPAALRGRR